jgi:CubicO group peptidase (beta-lactamase class C family)
MGEIGGSHRSFDRGMPTRGLLLMNLVYGEGNIYTTIDDMYRWDQALEKNKLVKPETLEEVSMPGLLNGRRRSDYGFGWSIERFLGFDVVRHNGLFADLFRLPDRRFTVVVLANCEQIEAPGLSEKITEVYLGGS